MRINETSKCIHRGICKGDGKCEEDVRENNREMKRDFREISIAYIRSEPTWLPDPAKSGNHAL
jgi:hypothetical protein